MFYCVSLFQYIFETESMFVLCELTFSVNLATASKHLEWVKNRRMKKKCYVVWFCECLKSRILRDKKTSVYNLRHRYLAIIVMDLGKFLLFSLLLRNLLRMDLFTFNSKYNFIFIDHIDISFLFHQVTLPNRTIHMTCTSNGGTK